MSKSKTFLIVFISFLASSLLLYRPLLVDWMIRNQREQVAREKLTLVRSKLYTPLGVSVLKESESFRLPATYFSAFQCFGASANIIYGTNRSIDEIREVYSRALTDANWKLDSGYKPSKDYIVYNRSDEYEIVINMLEDFTEPPAENFKAIYSVTLSYMTPSHHGCTG